MFVMLILSLCLFLIFILNKINLCNCTKENIFSDKIANKIRNYIDENQIPLILEDKLIGDESGSMSSSYNGYLKISNASLISVIIKYSSFKSIWNYVHINDINRLYEQDGCFLNVNENTNEYLVLQQEKNRIIYENLIPCEVYVAFKGLICSELMPTSTIVDPQNAYFSFFKSIEQTDDERGFFLIFQKLENGMSLKKYLQYYSNNLTIEIAKYLIYSILHSIIKLKHMSIIHLDLNLGNIFVMNNDNQHSIRFIDFAIIKFIHNSSNIDVMYSETLHQSLRNIFLNCPSCYHHHYSNPIPIYAQHFHQSFQTYSIEQLIEDPWFYTYSLEK